MPVFKFTNLHYGIITVLMVSLMLTYAGKGLARQGNLLTIGAIQGSADISPYINEIVSFRGVVTGFYEDRNTAGLTYYTLFVQDIPGFEDADPDTSDGIAVFLGRQRPSARHGDQVYITGQVTEFFGLTEIDDDGLKMAVERTAVPLPAPVPITPPPDNQAQSAYFEALEGMLVTIAGSARVTGPTFNGCGLAVVGPEAPDTRIIRQTTTDPIGQIVPILHTSDVTCSGFPHVKTGDQITGLTGPLIYHFDQFKLVQQKPEALVITAVNTPPVPTPPVLSAGQFSVATYNLENHFDERDDTGDEAEPKPSAVELANKQAKIARQISEILGCPTLIGVQEVENEAILQTLADLLTPLCGFTYAIAHLESADVRGIDVALLSDPRRVAVQHAVLQQTCTAVDTGIIDPTIPCPVGQQPLFSRPPLQVTLEVDGRGYTVFVNHFKSKRGGETETAPARLAQAQHLHTLTHDLLAVDPHAAILVLGDFNDYERSPTLLAMTDSGQLTNLLAAVPLTQRYSFIFGGAAQLLDGILASPALVSQVDMVTIQHVNADYPQVLAADPHAIYRATDHDLPLVVLNQESTPAAPATAVITPPSAALLPSSSPVSLNAWGLTITSVLVLAGGAAVYRIWRRR